MTRSKLSAAGYHREPRLLHGSLFAAGLRAHELISIRPANELQASTHRDWSPNRFAGREGELFVVAGKGGLRREVMLSHALAEELKGRSRILLLLANHKNALFTLVFGKIDFPEHRRTF